MYKICLALIGLCFCSSTMAQKRDLLPQEFGSFGAINTVSANAARLDGDYYFAEAEKFEHKGDMNQALTLFGKAAFEYNTARNYNSFGQALIRMSNVHLLMNHYKEAEQVILNVALKNYSKIGSRSGQMLAYNQLGKVYYNANKLTEALWFYTQQGILARQIKDNPAYIDSMLGIIFVKIKKKQYSMALKDVATAELFATNTNTTDYTTHFLYTRSVIDENSGETK